MRGPARVGATIALALVTASGCSALFPLDNLAGSATEASDAAVDTGAGPGADTGLDASVEAGVDATAAETGAPEAAGETAAESAAGEAGDASSPVDAPSDVKDAAEAAVEAEAAAPPYCASLSPKPALCEDFDEGAAFDAQFTTTYTAVPANLGADGALFKSPPDSLFSKINAGASSNNSYEYMERVFTGTSTRVDYAFDMLLVQTVTGHEAVTAMVIVNEGLPTEHDLGLVLGNLKTMEEAFTGDAGSMVFLDTPLAAFPTQGVWSRVDIVVSLATRTMTVTVDGAAAMTAAPLDPSWPTSGPISVRLGISFANDTTTPWLVRYDDVTVSPQ